MAITTLTPGVYIDEISTLPPSVAPVATAIPAFIGYTENHAANAFKPTRITSLPEFSSIFGSAKPLSVGTISVTDTTSGRDITFSSAPSSTYSYASYNLFYSLQLYFANGGGPCWIVSVGSLTDTIGVGTSTTNGFLRGLAEIEKIDEPTLLLFPEAASLSSDSVYAQVTSAALTQCAKLQDRFMIADTQQDSISTADIASYRSALGVNNLKYGAVYAPYLNTVLNFSFDEGMTVAHTPLTGPDYSGTLADLNDPDSGTFNVGMYRQIYVELNKYFVIIPPSGAIAGIYASVDRDRGVWKAPANISINAISGPTITITASEQDLLNVDASSGKSINAIRPFTGKGTLVWGARTLAGNDNEWRYVNVRRLFIYAEESIKKASEFVVFEPNDKNTWERVRGLISSFLTNLWRDGALVGPTPAQAFFVKVGLGETMTPQDVLEGKLIVEVGMAASRPAEFIILKFSHKLQEA